MMRGFYVTVMPRTLTKENRFRSLFAVKTMIGSIQQMRLFSTANASGRNGEPLIEVHTTEGVQISEDISHGARMQGVMSKAFDAIRDGGTFEPTVANAV